MDKKFEAELELLLKQARFKLLNENPFFGDLTFGTPVYWDDKLDPPTAATNGVWVKMHPSFFKSLTVDERIFLQAHEALHCVLLHCVRAKGKDTHKWKVAIDIVVNFMLVAHNVGTMPKCGVYDAEMYRNGNGEAEKIYELLTDEYCKKYNTGSGNEGFDVHEVTPEGEEDNLRAKWQAKLREAANLAKSRGKLSGDLEEFVDSVEAEEVSWKEHIFEAVCSPKGQDRTWTKTNRRTVSSGASLPGKYGDEVGPMVLAIDCSGSTSDEMVGEVGEHAGHLQEQLRPEKIHVIYFDSSVKKHEEYGPDDPVQVKAYGRGGTAFSPIFKYIEDNDINPTCCIVCTDLECDDFGDEPDYPVLWCVMESDLRDAPWGKVLPIN